jgi:hypothetical protein
MPANFPVSPPQAAPEKLLHIRRRRPAVNSDEPTSAELIGFPLVFEAFKTEKEKVAELEHQMSPEAVKSYRLASILLVLNALLLTLLAALTPGPGFPLVTIATALLLARALHQLKSNWADAIVVISVAGTGIQTFLQLWAQPPLNAIVSSLGSWGVAGALVLLLTGEPSPRRRAIALAVFIILTGGFYLLALASLAARSR